LSLVLGAMFLGAGTDAIALGFGRTSGLHLLGQPLSFSVPLQLEEDEVIESPCTVAEVFAGDQRVPPSIVRTSVERSASGNERVVRVSSSAIMEEPVVTVALSVGCPPRLSQRFVLLLDPPTPQYVGNPETAAVAPATPQPENTAPRVAPAAAVPVASTQRSAPAEGRAPPVRRPAARPARAASAPVQVARAAPRPAAPSASMPQSRLKLDPLEVSFAEQAVAIAAANAASAAADAASAAAAALEAREHVRSLEESLARTKLEAKAAQDGLLQMRARMREAEVSSFENPVVYALSALSAALLVAVVALLRQRTRDRDARWWKDAEPVGLPLPLRDEPPPVRRPAPVKAEPEVETGPTPFTTSAAPMAMMQATRPLPVVPPPPNEVRREVTVEELIDLEQQAEFFVVLGQDEAAIDLLMGHLRSTGGISPLPYLKLLEIYRRRNEREAYERMRHRFNHRFNAYAPDWDSDLSQGRSLDDYPQVTQRLQALWDEPGRAMEYLESLLFRKVQEGPTFDLPAYREVLLLYSMARDLSEHEPGGIDLLLPLEEPDAHRAGEPLTFNAAATMTLPGALVTLPEPAPPSVDIVLDLDMVERGS
jgi:hypothetical protein